MHRRTALLAITALHTPAAFALYDPQPNPALILAPGAWKGSLTYRDWTNPEKLVTLPCTLAVALSKPDELALYYVFNDGPGKTVFSYDKMAFDFNASNLHWTSGTTKANTTQYRITEVKHSEKESKLAFERSVAGKTDRYVFELSKEHWRLAKTEVAADGAEIFRNKYEFSRNAS